MSEFMNCMQFFRCFFSLPPTPTPHPPVFLCVCVCVCVCDERLSQSHRIWFASLVHLLWHPVWGVSRCRSLSLKCMLFVFRSTPFFFFFSIFFFFFFLFFFFFFNKRLVHTETGFRRWSIYCGTRFGVSVGARAYEIHAVCFAQCSLPPTPHFLFSPPPPPPTPLPFFFFFFFFLMKAYLRLKLVNVVAHLLWHPRFGCQLVSELITEMHAVCFPQF